MIVHVGFTGTRKGMSERQKLKLASDLRKLQENGFKIHFHHGDCIGADDEADNIARNLGAQIYIHAPLNPKYRAFCAQAGDILYGEKPYLVRDRDIVDSSALMYGAPKNHLVEEIRSGTWTTIRYAKERMKKTGKPERITVLER